MMRGVAAALAAVLIGVPAVNGTSQGVDRSRAAVQVEAQAQPPVASPAGSLVVHRVSVLARVVGRSKLAPQFESQVQFLSTRVGFALAATNDSTVLERTRNGGIGWQSIPTPSGLTAMDMIAARSGWIAITGHGAAAPTVLEYTSDSGLRWQPIALPSSARGQAIDQLDFLSARIGWVETSAANGPAPSTNARVYHTVNGGKTWLRESLPSVRHGAFADLIAFSSPSVGWVLTADQSSAGFQQKWLYRTSNGGESWTKIASSSAKTLPIGGYASLMSFVNGRVGYLQFARGALLRTADGGKHWTLSRNLPFDTAAQSDPSALDFLNPDQGYLIMGSQIWRTLDGGASWTPLSSPLVPDGVLSFGPTGHGFAIGFFGNEFSLLGTDSDGRAWHFVGSPEQIWQGVVTVGNTVWGLNETGANVLEVSHDGGVQFRGVSTPGRYVLESLSLTASRRLAIVGYDGQSESDALLTPTPQGAWRIRILPIGVEDLAESTSTNMWALAAPDLTVVDLEHSTNGGKTWQSYSLPGSMASQGVPDGIAFIGANVGYFWTSSALYLTRNGGRSWQEESLGTDSEGIGGVDFLSKDDGWLTTPEGLYRTRNGGRSWVRE